jgi:hypothetical protein
MNSTRLITTALAAALAFASSGCASIIKGGGTQAVSIRSMPSDADVKIVDAKTGNTIQTGKTPFIVPLNKSTGYFAGGKYRVLVEKPGFTPREVIVDSGVNGWYVGGNLLFGGLIGWLIVDPATGAMWNLSPEEVTVELQPAERPAQAAASKPIALMLMSDFAAEYPELVSKLKPVSSGRN